MAFKTKEEMFGDGGGYGAAVPYDTSNPAGTGAGNRGVQFGEQLTAAIANRTHYALALNDEDLNTRLAAFETGGLDGAYDLGTVGPAGGGRTITKDAGAVETVSALAANYADDPANAHFRAFAQGDTEASSTGFEFVAVSDGSHDGFAGFMDRRGLEFGSGDSVFAQEVASCTLNPGGAGADVVELAVGSKYWTTGNGTLLSLGVDLIEVSGSAGDDGLYFIEALGATERQVQLRQLNGALPTFPINETVTLRHYRLHLASVGYSASRAGLVATTLVGSPGSDSVLDIFPGRRVSTSNEDGASYSIRVFRRASAGGTLDGFSVDSFGHVLQGAPLTAAEAVMARQSMGIATSGVARYTLVEESSVSGTSAKLRRYVATSASPWGALAEITTFNALFTAGANTWGRDDAAQDSWVRGLATKNLSSTDIASSGGRVYVREQTMDDNWTDSLSNGLGWHSRVGPDIELRFSNWRREDLSTFAINPAGICISLDDGGGTPIDPYGSDTTRSWMIVGTDGAAAAIVSKFGGSDLAWNTLAAPGGLTGTSYNGCKSLNGQLWAWTGTVNTQFAYSTTGNATALASVGGTGIAVQGMAYGKSASANYKYVAVGAQGGLAKYAASPDETTWSTLTSPFGAQTQMNAIHYSLVHLQYIAGGVGGTLALWINPDGVSANWANTGVDTGALSITGFAEDDAGRIIAFGAASAAYITDDLVTFTAITLPTAKTRRIIWAEGHWVLVGTDSEIWTSRTGLTGSWP